jgi:di/tricarboxylate transporter
MLPEAWFTLATVVAIIAALAANRVSVEVAMLAGLALQLLVGAVDLEGGLSGFSHPAVIMIASLFVVAAGLTQTGATQGVAQRLLGRPTSVSAAQLRLMGPVTLFSAFMNNTPIVAMYLPIVSDWARKIAVSPSKLFMPLSYAAILGGRITLIGSASNMVVMGLYLEYAAGNGAASPLSSQAEFWGPAALGLPAALIGCTWVLVFSGRLLPPRKSAAAALLDARRYTVAMEVQDDSPIVGQSIERAGLRHLPGLYLSQIDRGEQVIPAPPPDWKLEAGDVLLFAGILESVVDLRKIRGLTAVPDQVEKVGTESGERTLVEAVVSHSSALVDRTVKESRFRTRYNAAIIAVHRNGEQIQAKVGDIKLRPGDTLLLDTHSGFVEAHRNSDAFYLVSAVEGSTPLRHERAALAWVLFGAVVATLTLTNIPPVTAALTAAAAMVLSGCVTAGAARSSVNLQVILVIASAIGIGQALEQTGAALTLADGVLSASSRLGLGPRAMLFVTSLAAAVFAQLLTNNGAAALMFPVAMATAAELGVSPTPFMFALLFGAGLSLMTPFAYQTNLMVYGPGGYHFSDFMRMGGPLTLVLCALSAWLAPWFFPL